MNTCLAATGLEKSYHRKKVVDDVSVQVRPGEVVGLLGPNGAGKTTTFSIILGLVPQDSGTIRLNGKDITDLPMYKRARKGISYLSQEPSIFRKMTVEENLMSVLETLDLSPSERKDRLNELMEEFGIARLAKQKAYFLSGGEKRRTEIARSLVISPKFLLLDEPFSGIDPRAVTDIQEIVSQLRSFGLGVLVTDHSVRETLEITDRAYVIADGEITDAGKPEQLLASERARELYFGDRFML